jgi:hypothetical protein
MNYRPQLFFFLVVLAAAITLACGSPMIPPVNCGSTSTGPNMTGQLESIILCPATVDAKSYPGGQVQFVATGQYSTPPSPVTPIKPWIWGACSDNVPTTAVSVTSSGVASCLEGASGTYTVFASVGTECNVIGPCGTGCFVTGTAHLTCP